MKRGELEAPVRCKEQQSVQGVGKKKLPADDKENSAVNAGSADNAIKVEIKVGIKPAVNTSNVFNINSQLMSPTKLRIHHQGSFGNLFGGTSTSTSKGSLRPRRPGLQV
jgi:hypothetical protein